MRLCSLASAPKDLESEVTLGAYRNRQQVGTRLPLVALREAWCRRPHPFLQTPRGGPEGEPLRRPTRSIGHSNVVDQVRYRAGWVGDFGTRRASSTARRRDIAGDHDSDRWFTATSHLVSRLAAMAA